MTRDAINRCVWIVDTIRRHGRITRNELVEMWLRSPYSDGTAFSRRSFYSYRDMIEELFNLHIECDPSTYEYYIEHEDSNSESVTNWLLNSMSLNDTLSGASDVADRIFVEDVPSAREYLGTVIGALRQCNRVRFDYHSYSRTLPTTNVVIEPYFLKLFKQRWYVVGRHVTEDRMKTYALDRMSNVVTLTERFVPDESFDGNDYFKDAYGIVVTQSPVHKVVLKVDSRQAKYFNALPLHPSQHQTYSDSYSLFTMHLRITDDFVAELLSHGSNITVLEPAELRARMQRELQTALDNYIQKK